MQVKSKVVVFEWDKWNLDKIYLKHGITPKEAEEVFISDDAFVTADIKHSQAEDRFIILGKTLESKNLFIVFTLRSNKTRIVSARRMHKKEVLKYDKVKKNTKI
ncbi:MAG: BrnT family toxin [Candidatus Woesebacteria bacterium]|nr:BrnT family toxin [Candidatus Woesebacteria bacterium]